MVNANLNNRVAIVTGGDTGIGAACTAAIAAAGSDVAVLYYGDASTANVDVKSVEALGGKAVAIKVDVADEASVEAGFDAVGRALAAYL